MSYESSVLNTRYRLDRVDNEYFRIRWREKLLDDAKKREKRTGRVQAVDPSFLESLSEPVSPEQERAEMLWDLDRLFDCLEERHKALLSLRYLKGYTTAECAEIRREFCFFFSALPAYSAVTSPQLSKGQRC